MLMSYRRKDRASVGDFGDHLRDLADHFGDLTDHDLADHDHADHVPSSSADQLRP